VEADLGRFSAAIYKKVTADAKTQRFQGFRPGTIPPHLEPTYRAFAMDECARETVLEAMQQNNIRPFENARAEFVLENFSIPPPPKKNNKNKKKKKKRKKVSAAEEDAPVVAEVVAEPEWLTFDDMKGAVDAGWKVSNAVCLVQGLFCNDF
jgi:FKBP-type peptidyl-prolyl cis-trans isomerase (trigger factor)